MLPSAPARPTAADAEAADAAGAVTLVLSREGRAGHEQAFEDVLRRLSAPVRGRTPPSSSKHPPSIAGVVSDRSSPANRTNRTRDQASTAQNTCRAPTLPQSIASTSPGAHTAGRRARWFSRRQAFLASATRRRK